MLPHTHQPEGHGHFVAGQAGKSGAANLGAGEREISGLISHARYIGESNRHAEYELTVNLPRLVPPITRGFGVMKHTVLDGGKIAERLVW